MDRNARNLGSILAAVLAAWLWVDPARGGEVDYTELSLDELMQVKVTSVSKRAQRLAETPAAVYVIDQEQIRRSGMQTVPDLLRMVPGLHVANLNANQWAISARGFNSAFANKLLVMIDGRSVYNPSFSGVWWDVQDLPLEDIERIEVVRGPGGTIWGANAVNGVINIITKEAKDTQGLLLSSAAGLRQDFGGVGRWGGALGDDFHYRAYVKGFDRRRYESPLASGTAHDAWYQVRGGFRSDWNATEDDVLTFQGDYYGGESDQLLVGSGAQDTWEAEGGNFLTRWTHVFSADSDLVAQAFYDREDRANASMSDWKRDTADLEVRHRYAGFPRNEIVWGANYRHYHVRHYPTSLPMFNFLGNGAINLGDFFLQDEITLMPGLLNLVVGTKLGYNNYTDFEYQPSGRILFTPHEDHTIWAAVSRAIRMPSEGEANMNLVTPFFVVSPPSKLKSEAVLAYEVGYRTTLLPNLSVDLAAYYNDYDHLRTLDFTGPTTAEFGSSMSGEGWGTELAVNWQASSFLRLMGAYTYMKVRNKLPAGSTNPIVLGDARHQFNIRAFLNLPWNLTLDPQVFWVDGVDSLTYSDGGVPKTLGDYVRFDTRLAWAPRPDLEFSLVGQNLTNMKHAEYGDELTQLATLVPRSFYGKVTWRY